MEEVALLSHRGFWQDKRVLVTGHTGFKGGWLCHWLDMMGSRVTGLSLAPQMPDNLFTSTGIADFVDDRRGDVRNPEYVTSCILESQAEIIFHLAAQPLVRASYGVPRDTFAVNIMGTVNVLESARSVRSVRAVVIVTSDKCYQNLETFRPYRESDAIGGHDPYSASKGCAELVTASYRKSFFAVGNDTGVASARAGNVIGGGDWAADRIVPDCVRAFTLAQPVVLRRPQSIRPWQHVLDPLSGYLLLAEALCEKPHDLAHSYNFGPQATEIRRVEDVVKLAASMWGEGACWECHGEDHLHEAGILTLDSTLARQHLGWKPRWSLEMAMASTIEWYRLQRSGNSMTELTRQQILSYAASPPFDAGVEHEYC
ncbi:MAG: CDP-glucose 4,6-dehydratase [Bryobacteraceae bacterium]